MRSNSEASLQGRFMRIVKFLETSTSHRAALQEVVHRSRGGQPRAHENSLRGGVETSLPASYTERSDSLPCQHVPTWGSNFRHPHPHSAVCGSQRFESPSIRSDLKSHDSNRNHPFESLLSLLSSHF